MPRVLFGVTVAMTAQAFLRGQLAEMIDRGWDVHLACSPNDGTDAFVRLRDLPGITLHPLPMARPPRMIQDVKSMAAWLRLVSELEPDVVVAGTPKAGLLGTLAARIRRAPARIYHVRGLRAEGLTGPIAALSRASERVATAAATEVLVDSQSLLRAMRSEGLIPADKGVVIGAGSCCGVDTGWFRPPTQEERAKARETFGILEHEVVIGFVGRLTLDKGVGELVAAAARLQTADARVRLVLIGPIENGTSIRKALETIQQVEWATAAGHSSDPREAYWAFDLFCLPSHREGFPISPLEAQACGLPVITTDATGCVDSIDAQVTGMIVHVGDVDDLTRALASLVRDRPRRERMGAAARDWVRQHFDRRSVTVAAVDFIDQALASARATYEP